MDKKRQEDVRKTKEALHDLGSRNTQIMRDYGSLGKNIGNIIIVAFIVLVMVGIFYFLR